MTSSFRLIAGKNTNTLFDNDITTNPLAGLMLGVLATVLVQSSSTATSIIGKKQQLIFSLVNTGYMCKIAESNEDGMEALSNQYAWLATKCKSLHEQNKVYLHDDFWKYLARIIVKNRIYTYTPHIIKQLQDTCWKHAKNNN